MTDLSYGEKVFIQGNGNPNRDNCHTNSTWDYVLFTDTEVGKQILSQVLTAYAADKTIKVYGDDTCPIGATEKMKRIEMY